MISVLKLQNLRKENTGVSQPIKYGSLEPESEIDGVEVAKPYKKFLLWKTFLKNSKLKHGGL